MSIFQIPHGILNIPCGIFNIPCGIDCFFLFCACSSNNYNYSKRKSNFPWLIEQENLIDTQIMVVFCLCADMLNSLHHYEDRQCQMNDAEVMTTAIIAML
jgi:hypothetical protein